MDNKLTQEKYNYIQALIEFRTSLSNGRVKPDNRGNNPYVRESAEYINLINTIDLIISDELNIHEKYRDIKKIDNIKNREEFLFKSVPNLED